MERQSPTLIIGIDFGMTCTGVAWSAPPDPIQIQKWPSPTNRRILPGGYEYRRGKVHSTGPRNFLPVLVNGREQMALPDTGSFANVVTEEYANSQGAFIDRHPSKRQLFEKANGKPFESVGQAVMLLAFPDTPGKVFTEVFSVVSKCAAPLVLGNSFLKTHEILTRFRYRLKKVAAAAREAWRLMHLDVPHQKFMCWIGGEYTAVTVDTGSEKNFFSRDYARCRHWNVQPLPSDEGFVELADGEIVKVSGYVDKEVSIGERIYEQRFYILDELVCDALLGDETTEEVDLYNEANSQNWVESEISAYYTGFYAIGWLDKIEDHVSEFLNDPTYQIPDRHMQDLLSEVQQQSISSVPPFPTRPQKWWDLRQRSQSRQQKRVNEQYQLLLSGIWIKLGKLDNTELEARQTAKRAMSQATDDDLRTLRSADETRRQQHIDKRTRLLELRSKLQEWKASRTSPTP